MAASEGWGDDDASLVGLSNSQVTSSCPPRGPSLRAAVSLATQQTKPASRQEILTRAASLTCDSDNNQNKSIWCPAASASMASPLRSRQGTGRVASLQGLCLGCLGEYIEELLACGPEAVAMLTAEQKAAMGTIARRRGLLWGDTLEALVSCICSFCNIASPAKLLGLALSLS
jgi:hypothetical protein